MNIDCNQCTETKKHRERETESKRIQSDSTNNGNFKVEIGTLTQSDHQIEDKSPSPILVIGFMFDFGKREISDIEIVSIKINDLILLQIKFSEFLFDVIFLETT